MPLFVYPERDGVAVVFYALGAFCRWLWRYRSELAPMYWTVSTVAVGAWLHAVHPGWWSIPAVLGTTSAVFLATVDRLPRLHELPEWVRSVVLRLPVLQRRRTERLWGAAVCASIGGWLTAATILGITGPATGSEAGPRVLRWLALFAMVGLGLPWWYSNDRKRLVRVRRVVEHFPETAEAAGIPGARMVSALLDRWGWTGRVKLRRGQHSRQVTDAVQALESALGTHVGAVRVEPVPSDAAEIVLRVIETDPHAEPIPYPTAGFPDATGSYPGRYPRPTARSGRTGAGTPPVLVESASVRRPITVGVWEDGEPVRVSLLRRHALIGGVTGSGKSGLLNVILAELVRCSDVTLWGIDLKNGMELAPWRSCLQRLAVTADQAVTVLRAGVAELERRAGLLAQKGEREWTPTRHGLGIGPALVIVVDEYAELPPEARKLADSIARRGRAVAVTLLVATQKPSQAAMGSGMAVRSQMDVRFCLRVTERRDTDLVLGQGMLTKGWDPTGFDAPGKFLLSSPEHTTPRRARAYLITDQQVRLISTQHIRPDLDRGERPDQPNEPGEGESGEDRPDPVGDPRRDVVDPDRALWAALRDAPEHGATIAELLAASGLSRTPLYRRLKAHQEAGRVVQTYRGRWRASNPHDHDSPGDSHGDNDGGSQR